MTAVEVTSEPIPHWPGRLVSLSNGEQVWLATTKSASSGQQYLPDAAGSSHPDPILCVHGMAGSATNWTDFMGELADDFACAAVDLPGYGFSPPPLTPAGYSIAALAETVIRVIEEHITAPVHLVGNSMGGTVAVLVAATRPDLVRTLTLISPALPDLWLRASLLQFPLMAIPGLGTRLVRRVAALAAEHRVAAVARNCFYDADVLHPDRFALEVAELRRRDQLDYAAAVIIGAARAIMAEYLKPPRWSLWHNADRITVPVLAVYGSHDTLVHPRGAARAARAFGNSRVVVLPRTGHVAQMEHPSVVAGLFREMVNNAFRAARE